VHAAALPAILCVAAALRLWQLDRDELWFDEAFAALVAVEPVHALVSELMRDSSPPLYFLLLRAWTLTVGGDPWTLRLLSVICGALAIWGVFVLGRQLFGWRAATAAAALLALSPLHIYYSREVRPYALLIALAMASLLALERLGSAGRGHLVTYVVVTLAAAYTHNYGLLLLAVLGVWVVLRRVEVGRAAAAVALVVLGYAAWLPALTNQLASGATSWVAVIWNAAPPEMALFRSLAAFCIGGSSPEYVALGTSGWPAVAHWTSYLVFAALLASALIRQPAAGATRLALALGVLLVLPLAASFVTPIYLVGRHDVVALPLFLLLGGAGLVRLRRAAAAAAGLAVAVLAIAAIHAFYSKPSADLGRRQAAVLLEHAGSSDPILTTGFTRNTVEYYVRHGQGLQPFHSFPTSFGAHRGWVDEQELQNEAVLSADARRLVASLREALAKAGTLWIIHSRELRGPNDLLMQHVMGSLRQVTCPGDAETIGISCWRTTRPAAG
jgi:4-amino-4-deoxy-L-arabinose transferase-like glycosyltransferase